ncbi:hypothetical protein MC885_014787 [Smutsia gigantea]|nr:hypothetical protein MC885_014787 [Smutsia gigantea]
MNLRQLDGRETGVELRGDLTRMEESSRGWAVPPSAQSMVSPGRAEGGARAADWTICTDKQGVRVPASQMDWAWTKPQELD